MPRLSPVWCFVLLSMLLSACATAPLQNDQFPTAKGNAAAALAAEREGDWQQAASEWLSVAGRGVDKAAQESRSRALSALLKNADAKRARAVFDSIDAQLLGGDSQALLDVLQAELLLLEGRPGEALVALPFALSPEAAIDVRARFLAVRGMALAEQGALIPAIEDFTARSQLLMNDPAARQDWQFKLWPILVSTDESLLRQGLRRNRDAAVSGWLKLGLIGQSEWVNPAGFESKLDVWRSENELHAANEALLPALKEAHYRRQSYPQNIVVLLPLSGRFASVGAAVRDGLLAAWYDLPSQDDGALPEITFVDTEVVPPAEWLSSLLSLEAGAVIGPLRKESLETMRELVRPDGLLWLPLNNSELSGAGGQVESVPAALALSPEQEARSAARRMGQDGYRRAVVIAAEGDWGRRVTDAFAQEFAETGASVVGVERYDAAQSDYGETIQRALLLEQSERRHARMTRALGRNVVFEARRRADVDAVFAPGLPRALRALRPQLKYYGASALPVYATSHVWTGEVNPAADLDLNDVRFADMPWNLQPSAQDKRLKSQLNKAGGSVKRGRFYALGADALRVLPMLSDQDRVFPWVFPGGTGRLALGGHGLLARQLVWAQFQKGKPVLLPVSTMKARGG